MSQETDQNNNTIKSTRHRRKEHRENAAKILQQEREENAKAPQRDRRTKPTK